MIVYKSYLFGNERPITFDTEIEVSVFVVLATAEEIAELTSAHEVSSSHPGKQFLECFFVKNKFSRTFKDSIMAVLSLLTNIFQSGKTIFDKLFM